MRHPKRSILAIFLWGILLSCNLVRLVAGPTGEPVADSQVAQPDTISPTLTPLSAALPTTTPIPTSTSDPTPTPTFTLTPTSTPYGCLRPPDDYTLNLVHGEFWLNERTLWMLRHAQTLYPGDHDFIQVITQGSYDPGLDASFGTHDGGGAVDLSVRSRVDFSVLPDSELQAIILALRQAGFAAWVRDVGELYNLSPIHIHAIAIGDAELSDAARDQLTGPAGYFRGFNGLPEDPPIPDGWGEPYICPWMLDMGYADLR